MAEMPGFSPPTRGCSSHTYPHTGGESLFPAHAGVIPGQAPARSPSATFPRQRGGDPMHTRTVVHTDGFSPPTRG